MCFWAPTIFGRLAPDTFDWVFGEPTVTSVMFGMAWLRRDHAACCNRF